MSIDQSKDAAGPAVAFGPLLAVFTAAIFLSAALLFAVQPIFTKMVLPQLGGSAAVWSVAMVFFQAVLLRGLRLCAPADALCSDPTIAVSSTSAVMLAAALTLPLGIADGWDRPPTEDEALWLLGLFAVSIGLPFFALSANAPLLQAWFARSDHPARERPVFPLRREQYRQHHRAAQLSVRGRAVHPARASRPVPGRSAFFALIVLIGACGVLSWRSAARRATTAAGATRPTRGRPGATPRPGWRSRRSRRRC